MIRGNFFVLGSGIFVTTNSGILVDFEEGKFFENSSPDTTRLEVRLRELERLIGELTVENRTLKKIIELVEPQKKASSRYLHPKTGRYQERM